MKYELTRKIKEERYGKKTRTQKLHSNKNNPYADDCARSQHEYFCGGGTWGPYAPASEAPILGYTSGWLHTFHIYTFTLISGYIFCYIKHERGGYQKYSSFICNKAKRLLVPYLFSAIVWAAPIHAFFFGTDDLVKKYVFGFAPSQLWFLLMLFWVFVIFWLISDMLCERPLLLGMIICVLYCVGVFVPGIYCLNSGFVYLVFFYIGFLIRKFDLSNRFLYKKPVDVFSGFLKVLECR